MPAYLDQIHAAPPAARWPLVRGWMRSEPLPLFAELRAAAPVLALPELTILTRYADCAQVLRRFDAFGVDLYVPKQGSYWMAQDDTPTHWRHKSIMRAILDREEVPAMRAFVGEETARRLAAAGAEGDYVEPLGRGVPVALVQRFFGFADADPKALRQWSYWNQQDAFHNQPFDPVTPQERETITTERQRAGVAMAWYLGRLVAKRAIAVKLGRGGEDPVSRLLQLTFSDALRFNLKAVAFNVGGLLIGAVETTAHATANALDWLTARPALWAAARADAADPARFDGHVFEALRFNPAFSYFFRTCHAPVRLGGDGPEGAEVAPGTTVLAVTHGAMHDAAVFPDPERFDPRRSALDGFTFGQGLHECLGRAIGAAMVPEIVRQVALLPDAAPLEPIAWHGGVPARWAWRWTGPRPATA